MKPIFLYFVFFIIRLIPVSRFFKLKNILLNISGAHVNSKARIYSNVKIFGNGGLFIGSDTFIGHEVIIISANPGNVFLGNNVDIGPRVYIGTGGHDIDPLGEHIAGKGFNKDIVVGDGCWIGANSTILPGVTIGKNVVVAAGSLVNRDIAGYTIVAGLPAIPVKRWSFEKNIWVNLK